MTAPSNAPPWAFEPCPGCGRPLPLAIHELTCPCFDPRTRVAVAWICEDCDMILGVGLFTSWLDAISARQRLLDDRGLRYVGRTSPDFTTITIDGRRNVITESRRDGTE